MPPAPTTPDSCDWLQPGTPESQWASWMAVQRFPEETALRLARSDLEAPRRLWVVAPHPDDEVMALGGLLGAWADLQCSVELVAVTDGGASHPDAPHWTPSSLMAARREESALSLQRLQLEGLVAEHRMGLPDGKVAERIDALATSLAALFAPGDRVWSTWRQDGHPDHNATGQAAARACNERGCDLYEYPVWMWHWAAPGDPRVPWSRLRRVRLSAELQARKSSAAHAHASQLRPDSVGGHPVLPATAMARWLRDCDYVFAPLTC